MDRICLIILTLLFGASSALAAGTFTYKAGPKMGPVTFNHAAHQTRYVKSEGCIACHPGAPGRIDAFGQGKKKAHALCYDCHKKTGIEKCAYCHK
jgi:hypothetical protein